MGNGRMKVIGLIGGMSWNSTLEYYRLINELVADALGGFHSARIVLYSLDFAEIERAQHEARWSQAADILATAGKALKQAGADFIVICTNTMHKVADAVAESTRLPVLNIIDVTGNAVKERGLRKIGLLGTRFIMEEGFYRDRLAKRFDIEVLTPPEEERGVVDWIIYRELCHGKIKRTSHRACLQIIEGLIEREAEGIILGCTELPLLIRPGDLPVPLFDTTRLHAEAAVELAMVDKKKTTR
jgi:aspartate racemase